jgi:3',5'-nucleoside bisphosphate phosphatase
MRCDFHIHSCLSPCASLDASPAAIARAAKAAGLHAIALTDHNSARNVPAFARCCRREGLHALYGIEICTIEEIHALALFDDPDAALSLGATLYDHLPDFPNIPEKLGDQPVVDDQDNVLELVPRYLGNATDIPYSRLPALVAERGGLFIPAHVDRPSFSVLSQLGTLPPESGPILEVTPRNLPAMRAAYGSTHALLTFSDAHHPSQIGSPHTDVPLEPSRLSVAALVAALDAQRAKR